MSPRHCPRPTPGGHSPRRVGPGSCGASGAIFGCAPGSWPHWSCGGGALPYHGSTIASRIPITDDAFVQTHVVNIAPQEVSVTWSATWCRNTTWSPRDSCWWRSTRCRTASRWRLLEAKLGVAGAELAAARGDVERLQAQVPREIEVAQQALAAAKAEEAGPGRGKNTAIHHGGHREGDSRGAVRPGRLPRAPARLRGRGQQAVYHALRERGRHPAAAVREATRTYRPPRRR